MDRERSERREAPSPGGPRPSGLRAWGVRRARLPRIEERRPPATTPERGPSRPRTPWQWALRLSGVEWAMEVRRLGARRERSRWAVALDLVLLGAIVLSIPTALLSGRVVVRTSEELLAEGRVFRVPPAADGPIRTPGPVAAATRAFVGGSRPAGGSEAGRFEASRRVDRGGFPFASRVVEWTPRLVIFDYPLGGDDPVADPDSSRLAPLVREAIADALAGSSPLVRTGDEDAPPRQVAASDDDARRAVAAWLGAGRSSGADPASRTTRLEPAALAANSLVAGAALAMLGAAAVGALRLASVLVHAAAERRRDRLRRADRCPSCGHDVRGTLWSAQCPECGELLR